MKALSVRQPWAWLLAQGFKDIENRSRFTHYRGPLLIHASKLLRPAEYAFCRDFLASKPELRHLIEQLPAAVDLQLGGIVGQVDVVGCCNGHLSPWFMGPYGYVVRDQKTLPFRPYTGALGFFNVPDLDAPAPAIAADLQPSLI